MTLREYRKRARYTQQQVAELIGCTRQTVARMERMPNSMTLADVKRLAELYSVPVDTLFFLEDDVN